MKTLVDVQQYNVGEFGEYIEVFRRIYGDCAGVLCEGAVSSVNGMGLVEFTVDFQDSFLFVVEECYEHNLVRWAATMGDDMIDNP